MFFHQAVARGLRTAISVDIVHLCVPGPYSVRISGAFTEAEAPSGKDAGSTLATTASFKSGKEAFDGMRALAMPGAGIQPRLTAVRNPKNRTAPMNRSRTIFAPGFRRCPVGGVEILLSNILIFPPLVHYLIKSL